MTCSTARRAIALGDEATPVDSRAAAAHAATCADCRAFAASPVAPLTRFREELPFGDTELARIRAQVEAAVRERAPRSYFAPSFGFAALAAIAVALFGYILWQRPSAEPGTRAITTATSASKVDTNDTHRAEATTAGAVAVAGAAVDPTQPSPQPRRPPTAVASRPGLLRVPRAVASSRVQPPVSHPPGHSPAVAAAAPSPLFIEIHTADPDVRILWIANQAPAEPNPTSVMED